MNARRWLAAFALIAAVGAGFSRETTSNAATPGATGQDATRFSPDPMPVRW